MIQSDNQEEQKIYYYSFAEKTTFLKNSLRLEIAILKDDLTSGIYTSVPRRILLEIQSELIEKERILKLINSGIQTPEVSRLIRFQVSAST
jgi:hypothetical protein